jgi:hypothetical protein
MRRLVPRTRRRRAAEPRPVGELLAQWLGRKHLDGEIRQYTVWNRWAEIVGERVAARTLPQSLRDGLLTVTVASSAWLNELSFMRADIVRRVNECVGQGIVTGLRLVAGRVGRALPSEDRPRAPTSDADLPPSACGEVDQGTEAVTDLGLRDAIRGAWRAQMRRERRAGPGS